MIYISSDTDVNLIRIYRHLEATRVRIDVKRWLHKNSPPTVAMLRVDIFNSSHLRTKSMRNSPAAPPNLHKKAQRRFLCIHLRIYSAIAHMSRIGDVELVLSSDHAQSLLFDPNSRLHSASLYSRV